MGKQTDHQIREIFKISEAKRNLDSIFWERGYAMMKQSRNLNYITEFNYVPEKYVTDKYFERYSLFKPAPNFHAALKKSQVHLYFTYESNDVTSDYLVHPVYPEKIEVPNRVFSVMLFDKSYTL